MATRRAYPAFAAAAILVLQVPTAVRAANRKAEQVLLTEAAAEGAVCLDGTPGAYYFRPGWGDGASKWLIHHQGGHWCWSLEDCLQRSRTPLGSSASYPAEGALENDYFSEDVTINPLLYNWNVAYLSYCDGGAFAGYRADPIDYNATRLYFRGRAILDAMQRDLVEKRGLSDATDVVVSGCSAGGLATYLHLDQWAAFLRASSARPGGPRVVGLPDSGWFMAYEGPPKLMSQLLWVFAEMNATGGVNADCLAAHQQSADTWKCIFPQFAAPYIRTRLFVLQSVYDSNQMWETLGTNDTDTVNRYGVLLGQSVRAAAWSPHEENGAFLDSCAHHCGGWASLRVGNWTQGQAFADWYLSGARRLPNRGLFAQTAAYPCEGCCGRQHDQDPQSLVVL